MPLRPLFLLTGSTLLLLASLVVAGCTDNESQNADPPVLTTESPDDDSTSGPPDSSFENSVGDDAGESANTTKKEYGGFQFSVPAGWEEAELSPFQRGFVTARYFVGDKSGGGDRVTMTVTDSGGGVQANLKRWRQQFQSPPEKPPFQEEIPLSDTTAHWLDIMGKFVGGMGGSGNDRTDWRMIGVIIPKTNDPTMQSVVALKLTGPAAEVEQVRDAFRDLVTSASRK